MELRKVRLTVLEESDDFFELVDGTNIIRQFKDNPQVLGEAIVEGRKPAVLYLSTQHAREWLDPVAPGADDRGAFVAFGIENEDGLVEIHTVGQDDWTTLLDQNSGEAASELLSANNAESHDIPETLPLTDEFLL